MTYPLEFLNTIIKAYDIRGLVEDQITPDFAFAVGAAFARYLEEEREPGTIVVGEDMRPSSSELAEAFAEYLHLKVRKELWGYASEEHLSNQELINEEYKGIRPAPGYPACPDHLEKPTIWKLLNVAQEIGVTLTESMAMWPAASVSGYYFANPESKYFGLGKIKEDQVVDYAKRRGVSTEVANKWLSPNIAD